MTRRKQGQEGQEQMVSMKMPVALHSAVKLIRKHYTTPEDKPRMADALWRFIQEKDPNIAKEAERVSELRDQLATLLGDDEE